jgi:hypothetical protein
MRPADAVIAVRWAKNSDRYLRLIAEADREPVVIGSTGQPRYSSICDLALKLEASVRDDEKQLGIGPLNRLRLGAQLTENAKSLAELNAEADHAEQDDDPRAAIIALARRRTSATELPTPD